MIRLASIYREDPALRTKAKDLAEELTIPEPMMSKVLHRLGEHGLIDTQAGRSGGVRLYRPPEDIPVMDIIDTLQDAEPFNQCIMGFPECSSDHPCPMHDFWGPVRASWIATLKKVTLQNWCTHPPDLPKP